MSESELTELRNFQNNRIFWHSGAFVTRSDWFRVSRRELLQAGFFFNETHQEMRKESARVGDFDKLSHLLPFYFLGRVCNAPGDHKLCKF